MSTTYTIPGVLGEDEGSVLGFAQIMNFVGAGVTATYAGGVLTVTIPGGGGGGGAPVNGPYLVATLDPTLTDERLFTSTTLNIADGGAGGNFIVDLPVTGVLAGSYTYASITVDDYGRITAASNGAAPAASGWTDGGTTVYLTTAADVVSVGNNVGVTNRKFSLYNTGTNLGASVVTVASTDNVIETFVTGEANLRWSVNGSGITSWGAGGASVPDLRIRRSGTSTLTIDNGGAGSIAVNPGGDGVGSIGSASLRWLDIVSNTFRSFPSAGAANASASLGSGFVKLGAGGATALDTAITRTAAKTLTLDDNAAGSMVLIVKGTTNTQQRIHGAASKVFADSPYTTAATDEMVFWSCTGGNCTQNLPTPVGALGRTLIVKRTDTTANTLTLTPAAGQVEGGASLIIAGGANRASITLMSDNANWWVI